MIDSLFLLVELAVLVLFLSAVRRGAKLPKGGDLGMFAYLEDPTALAQPVVKRNKGNRHA